eukprot:scaffold142080_cov22-Tisochrysis_lutea.AAC.1
MGCLRCADAAAPSPAMQPQGWQTRNCPQWHAPVLVCAHIPLVLSLHSKLQVVRPLRACYSGNLFFAHAVLSSGVAFPFPFI